MRDDLHRTVRQIACHAENGQTLGLLAGAVPEIDALNFARDAKAARYSFHGRIGHRICSKDLVRDRLSGRWIGGPRRRRGLRLCSRQSGCRMTLRLHRRQTCPRVLLRLQMLLSARNGGLRGVQIGRSAFGDAGLAGGDNGLTRIAHFLHRGTGAADEAEDTEKYRNDAQHTGNGH